MGLQPRNLSKLFAEFGSGADGTLCIPFLVRCVTVAGTSTYTLVASAPRSFKVINAWGIMTGAGDTSDTVKLTDGSSDITETGDVSGLSDKDLFDFTSVDDSKYEIAKGGSLKVVTASGATAEVWVLCAWTA